MSQFQFDNSALAALLPNFRPSDFWFLHRQFNPAYGLFTNLFLQEQSVFPPTQLQDLTIATRPVTFAGLFIPSAGETGGFSWGFAPFANTASMQCDAAGLLTVNAGAPTGTDDRVTGSVQLPINRQSFVVMAVNPGRALLNLWVNGRRVLRVVSPNGQLRSGAWATINAPGTTYRTLTGEGYTVLAGVRAAVFLNQLPRAFN